MIHDPNVKALCGISGYRSFGEGTPRQYYYFVPANAGPETPVVVSVHGISLNAAEHMVRMRVMAERTGAAVIAPWFSRQHYRGYQKLLCRDGETRADLALIDILDDFARRHGIDSSKVFVSGFSGGGQFAHRFALFHADRVAACATCAAGWYTFPDCEVAYPLGTEAGSGPEALSPHPDAGKVPMHILVGSRDDVAEPSLNMTPEVVAMQGVGRVTRAKAWHAAMTAQRGGKGGEVSLTILPKLGHDFGKAMERHALDRIVFEKFALRRVEEARSAA
ncbi:MAG: PHB depolymerase family esterase [Sphingomonadaceae bacterium]